MRSLLVALACLALLAGCGGGGGSAPEIGGGQVVKAGSLVAEGQVNTPESAVVSGVTVYALTGNISKATLFDYNPTADEAEILYSKDGSNGSEIVAVNASGQGQARSVVSNMTGPAFNLTPDPTGKYVYYLRNGNLQRTDLRDGTSNTILGAVTSFAFNQSGTKICYAKYSTDELWTANANGTGQALLKHYSATVKVIGCQSDTNMAVLDKTVFRTIDITTGQLGNLNSFGTLTFYWVAYSAAERAIYVSTQVGARYVVFRQDVPAPGHAWNATQMYSQTTGLTFSNPAVGPEQHFVGRNDGDLRVVRFNSFFQPEVAWPFDEFPYAFAWIPSRSSFGLAGAGSAFPSGVGALICTELGQRTPALVAADAVTRSSMVVTSLNDSQNGNPLYRIDCDNLKALSFANANGYVWKTVVGGVSGLKGAIVSFDSTTGQVGNIITFTKRPVITRQGKGWRIEGDLGDVVTPAGGREPAVSGMVLR